MRARSRILLVALAGLIATTAIACKPKNKNKNAPPPVAKQATQPGGGGNNPGAVGGPAPSDDDDENGDDGDRAAPLKQVSAKADADDSAAVRKRALDPSQALADPNDAAKKLGPAKVVLKKDRGACGEITVGKQTIKLDCDSESYGKVKSAAQPLLKEDDLTGAVGAPGGGGGAAAPAPPVLPLVVDFRPKKLLGPVVHQGGSSSCTAVSLAAVIDHELTMLTGKPADVSSMNIWARYAEPSMDLAYQKNEGKTIAPMNLWPYDWKLANKWDETKPPAPELFSKVEPQAIAKLVDVVQVDFKDLRGVLAQGHAIWFVLAAAHNIQKTAVPKGSTAHVIPAYDYRTIPPEQRGMNHALALVGYRTFKETGRSYYLIQNSWGSDWGEQGFAYIDQDTLEKNYKIGYTVQVEPLGALAAAAPKVATGIAAPTKCKPGLLPDAANGKCAARCADGSARNDGACAEAGECPAGEINVKGKCVRAAPTLKLKKESYAINCVPGGCLYGFAKGTAGCTREKGCVVACAAPTFKLVKTTKGIRCN